MVKNFFVWVWSFFRKKKEEAVTPVLMSPQQEVQCEISKYRARLESKQARRRAKNRQARKDRRKNR